MDENLAKYLEKAEPQIELRDPALPPKPEPKPSTEYKHSPTHEFDWVGKVRIKIPDAFKDNEFKNLLKFADKKVIEELGSVPIDILEPDVTWWYLNGWAGDSKDQVGCYIQRKGMYIPSKNKTARIDQLSIEDSPLGTVEMALYCASGYNIITGAVNFDCFKGVAEDYMWYAVNDSGFAYYYKDKPTCHATRWLSIHAGKSLRADDIVTMPKDHKNELYRRCVGDPRKD